VRGGPYGFGLEAPTEKRENSQPRQQNLVM
jgi:hypothetical protein